MDMIEKESLYALKEIMDKDYPKLIQVFCEDSEKRLNVLEQAIQDKDIELVHNIAHSMKGSASNIYAVKLRDSCYELEQQAFNQDISNASILYDSIAKLYQDTKSELEKTLAHN